MISKKVGVFISSIFVLAALLFIFLMIEISGFATRSDDGLILPDSGSVSVYFCPSYDCDSFYSSVPDDAHCALYNYKGFSPPVDTVVDWRNYDDVGIKSLNDDLMHNKYCVYDDIVITGSHNPSRNKNLDSVLVINSSLIAEEYHSSFDALKHGSDTGSVDRIVNISGVLVSVIFCPFDDCRGRIVGELGRANSSILFLHYAFTDDTISRVIVESSASVEGIVSSQLFDGDERDVLKHRILYEYSGPGLLHHKLFIIDNETVITGSANPSGNGYDNNDENVVIIKDRAIAKEFMKVYEDIKKGSRMIK